MEILYSDKEILVVVKPRGLLSESGEESVPTALRPDWGEVYPVHRLDRGVGGVMVYARNKAAAAKLSAAVQAGKLKKEYTAVVTGTPNEADTLRDMLYHDRRQNKTFAVNARNGAKEAILTYRLLSKTAADGVDYARISVQLQTGRTHQIRVQFATRGWPLVGDGKYGSRVKAPYPALYATALSFPHPKTGKVLQFAAPTPADFPWSLFAHSHFEIERKFLIAYPDPAFLKSLPGCRVKALSQTYLAAPIGVTRRVRALTAEGRTRYIETVKRPVSAIRAVEEERELTKAEYEQALQEADPHRHPVVKTRYCIPWEAHLLEIDLYDFWQDRATLEVELADETEPFAPPPFLQIIREVTDDLRYKNVNLAKNVPEEPLF